MGLEVVAGRFRLLETLGTGNMGEVHRAKDLQTPTDHPDRHVAVKTILRRRSGAPLTSDADAKAVERVTRQTAIRARRTALQLLRMSIVSAPEELRDQVRNLTRMQLIRTCAAWRPDTSNAADPVSATRIALKSLARRILELGDEIAMLDQLIKPLVTTLAPQLLNQVDIGIEIARQLLVTAGDNPQRMRSEASFAMLCGVAPLPASSGMTQRHRLNRGGDRQANSALHLAIISRIRVDQRTQAYLAKKTAEGHSKPEAIRCLKRYLAREVYHLLNPATPEKKGVGSRARRAGPRPARTTQPQAGQGTQGQGSAARPTAPAA